MCEIEQFTREVCDAQATHEYRDALQHPYAFCEKHYEYMEKSDEELETSMEEEFKNEAD